MSTYKEMNTYINTGGKELTQEQIEEAKAFIDSQGFKDMIREAKRVTSKSYGGLKLPIELKCD